MIYKLSLHAIKVNTGYYISDNTKYESWHSPTFQTYFFDGELAQKTFHKDWGFINKYPEKIEQKVGGKYVNPRYELIDKSLECEKFPLSFLQDVSTCVDSDGDRTWRDEYSTIQSLYKYTYDKEDDYFEEIDFEFIVIVELKSDIINGPTQFSFPAIEQRGFNNAIIQITNEKAEHELISKIMFPSILLHNTPCRLSSKQIYEILRQYIKEHINLTYAKITSDYDFCFEVQKNIYLAKPYTFESEITNRKGNSYHPKQFKKGFINTRPVKVFEMTHKENNYKGYTPISEIIGNSEDDLAEKIQKLCEDTIRIINEPLVECDKCNGYGVIIKE